MVSASRPRQGSSIWNWRRPQLAGSPSSRTHWKVRTAQRALRAHCRLAVAGRVRFRTHRAWDPNPLRRSLRPARVSSDRCQLRVPAAHLLVMIFLAQSRPPLQRRLTKATKGPCHCPASRRRPGTRRPLPAGAPAIRLPTARAEHSPCNDVPPLHRLPSRMRQAPRRVPGLPRLARPAGQS